MSRKKYQKIITISSALCILALFTHFIGSVVHQQELNQANYSSITFNQGMNAKSESATSAAYYNNQNKDKHDAESCLFCQLFHNIHSKTPVVFTFHNSNAILIEIVARKAFFISSIHLLNASAPRAPPIFS